MNVKTNAEKEWLRKLTTGLTTAKEDVKVPHAVFVYHFISMIYVLNGRKVMSWIL